MLSYLIWNGSPEIFSIGPFTLRWYGLLFALGFLVSQQILYYMHRHEGKPEKDVDTLTIYMIVATIIGARMGHVIFYQPELFSQNPQEIITLLDGVIFGFASACSCKFSFRRQCRLIAEHLVRPQRNENLFADSEHVAGFHLGIQTPN